MMPAALPEALAWLNRLLARVLSFTEPVYVTPLMLLQRQAGETSGLSGLGVRVRLGVDPGVGRGSHAEAGDEGVFGDPDVEVEGLVPGARVDHRAPDGGLGEARRDPALHLVAPDGDAISLACWSQTLGLHARVRLRCVHYA